MCKPYYPILNLIFVCQLIKTWLVVVSVHRKCRAIGLNNISFICLLINEIAVLNLLIILFENCISLLRSNLEWVYLRETRRIAVFFSRPLD